MPPTPCVGAQVRKLFVEPEVLPSAEVELKWTDPDEAGLVEFLVKEKVRECVCVCVCGACLGGSGRRVRECAQPTLHAAPAP